jgi:hypothetical protein
VTEPHDQLDGWLTADVTPLSAPPGTLDRIRRRARKRKVRQVVLASAACAVVLGGAVSAPQIAASLRAARKPPPTASRLSRPVTKVPSTRASGGPAVTASTPVGSVTPTQFKQRTALSATTSGTVPPPHFRPTSVTFVGTGQGGLVGAVIGQAGPPCATSYCTSLAGTSSYGKNWYGVSAPLAPAPSGGSGVSQLRFATMKDGWAFGPALYETSGGGWPWQQVNTAGQRVIDLEAAGQDALAIFATCTGTGSYYASDCTSFALYQGLAGSTTFTPVVVPAAYQHMSTTPPSTAELVIAGSTGYLLTPSGAVLSGPVAGGAWTQAGNAPCAPAVSAQTGAPAGAVLTANAKELLLTCPARAGVANDQVTVYTSDTGASWPLVAPAPVAGEPSSLTLAGAGQAVLATTTGLYYSPDGGKSWQPADVGGGAPAGGFSYVGMTTSSLGVAVPADSLLGDVYVTQDGGKTWSPSPITG